VVSEKADKLLLTTLAKYLSKQSTRTTS